MAKILFICLGNICRSPMAEYLCKHRAAERGIKVQAASAGTSGWHDGEFMHCGTADILDNLGIDSRDFVSSHLSDKAFHQYDYLIVMDDNNLRDVEAKFGQHDNIFKITDLLGAGSLHKHVPDPWYTGNFTQTRDLLTECIEILLDRIEARKM